MLRLGDEAVAELVAINDAEELCRRLLASPSGWRRSTRHTEAVELLASVGGSSDLPASFVALLLCTCRRWDRVTAKLIAELQDSGLLNDAELDELAEAFLAHEQAISYSLAWVSPEWLEVELDAGTGRTVTVDENTLAAHRPSIAPPLRRWAANRALRSSPARLDELLHTAERFEPRPRSALIQGLLDTADALDTSDQRTLVDQGLQSGQTSLKLTALDRLCELDSPETVLRRARSDTNATVRAWLPAAEPMQTTLL